MVSTKRDLLVEANAFYQAVKTGTRPKQKRGPISTHPAVPCPAKPEREVLAECIKWLKARRIVCWRHDVGAGDFGRGYATYGMVGGGDIIGILPNGIHIEIETKAGKGGKLSIAQQKRKTEVESSNGIYLIIHGTPELEYYMKDLL